MSNETIIRDTYKRINRFGLCLVEYSILKGDLIKALDKAREEGRKEAINDKNMTLVKSIDVATIIKTLDAAWYLTHKDFMKEVEKLFVVKKKKE